MWEMTQVCGAGWCPLVRRATITLIWFSSLSWHQPHALGLPTTSEGCSSWSLGHSTSPSGLWQEMRAAWRCGCQLPTWLLHRKHRCASGPGMVWKHQLFRLGDDCKGHPRRQGPSTNACLFGRPEEEASSSQELCPGGPPSPFGFCPKRLGRTRWLPGAGGAGALPPEGAACRRPRGAWPGCPVSTGPFSALPASVEAPEGAGWAGKMSLAGAEHGCGSSPPGPCRHPGQGAARPTCLAAEPEKGLKTQGGWCQFLRSSGGLALIFEPGSPARRKTEREWESAEWDRSRAGHLPATRRRAAARGKGRHRRAPRGRAGLGASGRRRLRLSLPCSAGARPPRRPRWERAGRCSGGLGPLLAAGGGVCWPRAPGWGEGGRGLWRAGLCGVGSHSLSAPSFLSSRWR